MLAQTALASVPACATSSRAMCILDEAIDHRRIKRAI